jgi:death-on-curing protein
VDSAPFFLNDEDIVEYHSEQIRLYGGSDGIGNPGLLESALSSPRNLYCYDLNAGLFDIATAYAFHISQNQAFNDGNKRTGLQAAIAFLKLNGYVVETSEENLFELMISLAKNDMTKGEFSRALCACSIRERGLTALLRSIFGDV